MQALLKIFSSFLGLEAHDTPVGITQINDWSKSDALNVLSQPLQTGKQRELGYVRPCFGSLQQQAQYYNRPQQPNIFKF